MAKTTKRTEKTKRTEGLMPDGSDLHFVGVDAVYEEVEGLPGFNIGDPRQVAARLAARKESR